MKKSKKISKIDEVHALGIDFSNPDKEYSLATVSIEANKVGSGIETVIAFYPSCVSQDIGLKISNFVNRAFNELSSKELEKIIGDSDVIVEFVELFVDSEKKEYYKGFIKCSKTLHKKYEKDLEEISSLLTTCFHSNKKELSSQD